jgi:hypothetical protein
MDKRLDDGQIEMVDDAIAEILRWKTPAERLEMVGEANRTLRHLIAAQVRSCHPGWGDREVLAEVARRLAIGAN